MSTLGSFITPRTAALAIVIALATAGCGNSAPPSAPNSLLGQTVSFSLPSNTGSLVSVPVPGAHYTVLDFFAPNCKPCKKKLPKLYAKRAALQAKGADLVLVADLGDATTDDAQKALASWGVGGATFLVDHGDVSRVSAGVRGLPATLVLDAHGTLRWAAPPTATAEQVVEAVP
jgi:thiol-disulfide isomerase/thioredoxin